MAAKKKADAIRVPSLDEHDSVMDHREFERCVCGDGRRGITHYDDEADYLRGRSADDPTPLYLRVR